MTLSRTQVHQIGLAHAKAAWCWDDQTAIEEVLDRTPEFTDEQAVQEEIDRVAEAYGLDRPSLWDI